jgi:hypothetical protein
MSEQVGYRKIAPRDLEIGDMIWVNGRLEMIGGLGSYGPAPDRPWDCPIRPDWRAYNIHTQSGDVWWGEPVFPGKK